MKNRLLLGACALVALAAPEAGPARAFVSTERAELVDGPTPLGRVGDYVLDNDRVRFVIEADTRVIGP